MTVIFLAWVVAMSAAYGAGFVSAERLRETWSQPGPAGPFARLVQGVRDGDADDPSDASSTASSVTVAGTPAPGAGAPSEPGVSASPEPIAGSSAAGPAAPASPPDFDLFWQAARLIDAEQFGETPAPEDVTFGAIRGSLRALDDPYTLFSDPVDTAVQQPDLEGEFEGIGAYVGTNEDGQLVIQTPMRGQPAERAGVRAGDIVIKVDGSDITELDVNEAVLRIRGPKGTTVVLTILRTGEPAPLDIAVVRDKIDIPSVNNVKLLSDLDAGDVGYLQLTVFAAETPQELRRALDELRESGARAIILDLRNNPGGYLNAAIDVASEFLADGVVVYQEDSRGRRMPMEAKDGGSSVDLPLVVLVNRGSASASEIVAGAIRDRGRGVLVGETTYGKGSVQNVHDLSDGSQLRVTVAVWLTPNGTLIHKEGIAPDVIVTPAPVPSATATPTPRPTRPGVDPAATATEPPPSPTPAGADLTDQGASQADDAQLRRAILEALRLLEGE